jgi:cytochrome c peroxidase
LSSESARGNEVRASGEAANVSLRVNGLSDQTPREIAQVEAEIDRVEAQTIERLATLPDNQVQQVELLGKLLLYDKYLSVNRNEARAFFHMPETGFTGPVSELRQAHAYRRPEPYMPRIDRDRSPFSTR